jgi:hypothetical protein
MVKYKILNYNEYSNQRYPTTIFNIEKINFISKKYPDGAAQIRYYDAQQNCSDSTGLLKIYKNKKGVEYVIFGGYELNLDIKNEPVMLIGLPYRLEEHIKNCGGLIE